MRERAGYVKLAAEYIYYRKVGDHATNMPSAVYFGKKSGDKFPIAESIKYKYDKMGNICRIDENGAPVVWYKYDALNRLIREDNKSFGKTWLYSYDNKGNISGISGLVSKTSYAMFLLKAIQDTDDLQ